MSKCILICGGSGLLGVNLAIYFRNRVKVILALNKKKVVIKNVKNKIIDLNSIDNICSIIESESIDLVINASGYTNIEKCEEFVNEAINVNTTIPLNLAKACNALGVKLVHISTDHLFSGDRNFYKEISKIEPQNVYGHTKHRGEIKVLENCKNSLIIRTNFFGWGPKYRSSFSDYIIYNLKQKNKIFLFENVFFTPIATGNFITVLNCLIFKNVTGVYNIVGDERVSKYNFGLKLAKAFNLDSNLITPIKIEEKNDLVKRPKDLSLSNEKVRKLLGRPLGLLDMQIESLKSDCVNGIKPEIRNIKLI